MTTPEDKTCDICKMLTDNLAGNPGKWSVRIYKKIYHWECVAEKLEENERLKTELEFATKLLAKYATNESIT